MGKSKNTKIIMCNNLNTNQKKIIIIAYDNKLVVYKLNNRFYIIEILFGINIEILGNNY